ncbi:MAG: Rho-binding antiterminator [Gammaproteobacteria bacterium]|nr:Rho-binding antiterminator [Gammaproteobacteria bacterium]
MGSHHNENDYRPISCASYDTYEIAIMHRQRLHLVWDDGNVIYEQIITPLNLRTAGGAEYLVLRTADGDTREVRLDHVRRAQPA